MITCPYASGEYRQDIDILLCYPTGVLTSENMADIATCRNCIVRAGLNQVNRFHDLRGITSVEIHFDDVFRLCSKETVTRDPQHPIKACYLVTNELVFGMIRMYEAMIEGKGVEVHVSYDIDELAEVLGVNASQLITTKN